MKKKATTVQFFKEDLAKIGITKDYAKNVKERLGIEFRKQGIKPKLIGGIPSDYMRKKYGNNLEKLIN